MASDQDALNWLKQTFAPQIDAAVAGTPFSRNLILAIAMQETSYLWRKVMHTRSLDEVLSLCVGDTIDGTGGREAFPVDRAHLEAWPRGKEMFAMARKALEDIATIDADYARVAKNQNKFCHGYGMFQYDLQSFKHDPDYFLTRKWATFDGTLGKCLDELREKLAEVYPRNAAPLTHDESVYVGIAYNAGSVNLHKDFRQGYKDDEGEFYGVHLDRYLTLAENTP